MFLVSQRYIFDGHRSLPDLLVIIGPTGGVVGGLVKF